MLQSRLSFSLWGKLPADAMTALAKRVTHRRGQSFAFSETPLRVRRGGICSNCARHLQRPLLVTLFLELRQRWALGMGGNTFVSEL